MTDFQTLICSLSETIDNNGYALFIAQITEAVSHKPLLYYAAPSLKSLKYSVYKKVES